MSGAMKRETLIKRIQKIRAKAGVDE